MNEKLNKILRQLALINEKLDCLSHFSVERNIAKTDNKPLSAKEAAGYLHLSLSRIYCLINEGKLKALQKKKYARLLFTTDQLNEYLSENK
jgi:excisionase family DNA binding protein